MYRQYSLTVKSLFPFVMIQRLQKKEDTSVTHGQIHYSLRSKAYIRGTSMQKTRLLRYPLARDMDISQGYRDTRSNM